MASNLYGNDSDDGESESSFRIDSDEDDDNLYNDGFQPITEDMLTLEVTRGLDDIYTGEKKKCLQFLYEAQIDFTNGLISRFFFVLF